MALIVSRIGAMERMPALSDLEYFLSVLAEGSLTKAAKRLRVQQSTLTQAIRRLESFSGSPLFLRTREGVQLTQLGSVFSERAKSLLENWYGIKSELKGEKPTPRSRLSFGCHQSTGFYTLKHFLPGFIERYPEIELSVRHDYTGQIAEDVLRHRLDFGLTVNPIPHPELVAIPLYRTFIGLWGLPGERNHKVLLYDPKMYGIELVMAKLDLSQILFERQLTISSLETIASLVINGGGRGILPADTACGLGLAPLELLWEAKGLPEFRVCLIHRKENAVTQAAEVLIGAIQRELSELVPGRKFREKSRASALKPMIAPIKRLN